LAKTIFIDTGPIVAILNKRDEHHLWVVEQAGKLSNSQQLITNFAVIQEVCYLLRHSKIALESFFEMIESNLILVKNPYPDKAEFVHRNMKKYFSSQASFADICLVAMINSAKDYAIFTLDSDFQIYRDLNGKTLKLIAPFYK